MGANFNVVVESNDVSRILLLTFSNAMSIHVLFSILLVVFVSLEIHQSVKGICKNFFILFVHTFIFIVSSCFQIRENGRCFQ